MSQNILNEILSCQCIIVICLPLCLCFSCTNNAQYKYPLIINNDNELDNTSLTLMSVIVKVSSGLYNTYATLFL